MAPPRSTKENRAKDKPRLDVSTPAPALKHSPFATLVGASSPAADPPKVASAASATSASSAAPAALIASATSAAPATSATSASSAAPAAPIATATPIATAATAKPPVSPAVKPRGRLILRRETKHRGGKTVVIVSGFAQLSGISDRALEELLQELKQRLGCGGSVTARELLLQGDRPAQVAALLRERGFRVDGVTG